MVFIVSIGFDDLINQKKVTVLRPELYSFIEQKGNSISGPPFGFNFAPDFDRNSY